MRIQISFNGEQIAFAEEDTEEGEEAVAEVEQVPNPVIPEVNHILWALGSFLLLWALMKFVLLPPILNKREEREQKVVDYRESADRARQAAVEAQADYDASLASARGDADGIIEAARSEANDYRSTVMAEAGTEVADMRAQAAGGVDSSKTKAISSLRGEVGDIAVSAASAVLGKDLDRGAQQSAIDEALNGGNA